jgi:hypothetical protein
MVKVNCCGNREERLFHLMNSTGAAKVRFLLTSQSCLHYQSQYRKNEICNKRGERGAENFETEDVAVMAGGEP